MAPNKIPNLHPLRVSQIIIQSYSSKCYTIYYTYTYVMQYLPKIKQFIRGNKLNLENV